MRVSILYNFTDGPWGGANQFLKALKNYFISIGCYEPDYSKSDIILLNSHPSALFNSIPKIIKIKKKYPDKIIVNRIDGPISLIRGHDFMTDKALFLVNDALFDATVFQSNWSRENSYSLGMKRNNFETVIINAPDPNIFYKSKIKKEGSKIRIVATSWSPNWRKGFNVYKWLDNNLCNERYQMTFIGNSPVNFRNIIHLPPMEPMKLSSFLRESHIYITASMCDPCSNSLIEALHCGLPAICLKDGGHPEIVKKAGEMFITQEEIPHLIEDISKNYQQYQKKINLPDIQKVGGMYFQFMHKILKAKANGTFKPKKVSYSFLIRLESILMWIKVMNVLKLN